jgi:hypothetical protein
MSKLLEAIRKKLRNPVRVVGVKHKKDGSLDDYAKTITQVEIDDDLELQQFVDACENDSLNEGVLSSITTATGLLLALKYNREVKSRKASLKALFNIKGTDNLREMIPDLNDALKRLAYNQGTIEEANAKRQHAISKGVIVGVALSRLGLKKGKKR